jgi:hypothetical protein
VARLVRAATALVVYALGLRLWGFRHTLRRAVGDADQQVLPAAAERARALAVARQCSGDLACVARLMPRVRCLATALALLSLLRRGGVAGRLRLGVRRCGTGLQAHAWVEVYETVIGDMPDVSARFMPLEGAAPFQRQPY